MSHMEQLLLSLWHHKLNVEYQVNVAAFTLSEPLIGAHY